VVMPVARLGDRCEGWNTHHHDHHAV